MSSSYTDDRQLKVHHSHNDHVIPFSYAIAAIKTENLRWSMTVVDKLVIQKGQI